MSAKFEAGQKFISSTKRRSTRENATKAHASCRLCEIANESTTGFLDAPVELKCQFIEEEKETPDDVPPQGAVILSHEDLKRMQVEYKLT